MKAETYREHLNELQLQIEELKAQLKEAQTGDHINRKAAIDALNNIFANYVPYLHGVTECIPLDCAVAIQTLPSAQPDSKETSFTRKPLDTISRQAAIDVVKGIDSYFVKYIEELPSAQPEERTNKRTETHTCDCISRQAAIDGGSGT